MGAQALELPDPHAWCAVRVPVDVGPQGRSERARSDRSDGSDRSDRSDPAAFRLDPDVARAADGGHLVAGRERLVAATGSAAVLDLPRGLDDERALRSVRGWLHELGGDDAAVALGAFPFDRAAPARLVVPSTALCRAADGSSWSVEVRRRDGRPLAGTTTRGDGAGRRGGRRAVPAGQGSIRVREVPAPGGYEDAVAAALSEIASGSLSKVVLGRALEVSLPAPRTPSDVLKVLWNGDAAFAPFSIPTPAGRLVGASPELLVGRHARRVVSHAFAGTIAIGGEPGAPQAEAEAFAALFGSQKDRAEHRLAVEEVAACLAPRCTTLDVPPQPTVMRLRSDARLGTLVRGTLRDERESTALSLLSLLHPTPAVGGVPRDAATKAIGALESFQRGYWAGAAGWIDARGDGEWVLSIRSVVLGKEGSVRLAAGAGIVAGSSPPLELAETTLKLAPVLDALWPGAGALLLAPGRRS